MSLKLTLPKTDLAVHPLCLGGNVFGWSADKDESFAVLDAYVAHGGNFIDTADMYSEWAPGNKGHDSEAIIGEWMKARGNRSEMVIATKVAKLSSRPGLSASNIAAAIDDSLAALQTDYVDLYYAHEDDANTPLEESLEAFDVTVKSGKVRYIAASNYSADRLTAALEVSRINSFASFVAIQNMYNLVERNPYESEIAPVVIEEGLSGIPYFGLARGFLTGKYRAGVTIDSVRAGGVTSYQNAEGYAVVDALEQIAKEHGASIASIALAWLRAQPSISTPIASARTVEQLEDIVKVVHLTEKELTLLSSLKD